MTRSKRKFGRAKDKFSGAFKVAAGKITGNERLELKGKIQTSRASIKKKMDIGEKIVAVEEVIAGKINDKIDARKKK